MINPHSLLKYLEIPDKSASDRKDYKCLFLSNGLKLLLVSDNKTGVCGDEDNLPLNEQQTNEKLSAVALLVDVGSFAQPREYQGLAHFLKHMIFMGSKKYPTENSFDTHLTNCGGIYNACTYSEETIFYFEVPEKHLASSLDCFAAQLKEPLFVQESMTRERAAVESEYQLTGNNEGVRHYQLLQSLATENYPHENLTWGNLKSLQEDIENDQELHKSLVIFYKRHYSADRMFACIQSCLPLQQLEHLAIKHLGDIRSHQLPGVDFSQYNYQEAFKKEFFEEVFFIKPKKNECELNLTWVLPSTLKHYKCKPCDFLAYLFGYEGKGSLCAYLRKRLWALQVMAGPDANSIFTLFTLSITLTELGLENLDDVLRITFSYIKLFNKASELKEIYREVSLIKDTNFHYAAEMSPGDNVQYLVACSKYYPSKDLLTGPQLFVNHDENEMQHFLDHITTFHFNMTLTSHQGYGDVVYDKKEKWFGIEYTSKKIPEKWLELWHNCQTPPELFIPQTNPFLAQDFRIFWLEGGRKNLPEIPEKLMQTERFELWFRQDDKFHLPHGCVYFHFVSPLLRKSARSSVVCALYLDLVKHLLAEELYPATEAGIDYQIYCAEKGVILAVSGYNEKLVLVVELLIKALISTKDRINESQLEMFKKQHQKDYFNALMKPEVINMDLQAFVLKAKHWLMTEKIKYIYDINLCDIQLFAEQFTQELYVQALIQGNLQYETPHTIISTVMKHLNCCDIKEKSFLDDRATEIPLGAHKILCNNLYSKDCNSVITNFYQIGPRSLRNECILNLLIMILEAPLFETLQTTQQLGYSVSCDLQSFYGVVGYVINVSSQHTKHSASFVEQCIETSRQDVETILNGMSVKEFENFKNSLIKLKKIKDVTLFEEVSRNWSEITSEEYLFQRRFEEIAILKTLKKQDILEFWLKNETENLRQLTIQVVGAAANTMKESGEMDYKNLNDNLKLDFVNFDTDDDGTSIINVKEFKDNLIVYPVIKTEVKKQPGHKSVKKSNKEEY